MDPLRSLSASPFALDPSLSLYPPAMPGLDGAALTRAAGGLNPGFGANPTMQLLMQNQLLMQQTMLQLLQLMMQLMTNGGAGVNPLSSNGATGTAPANLNGSSGSSGSGANASNSAGSSGSAASGPIQPTETGKKLAEIARAEATNGDSSGGWCYRDVGRALAKIGINVSGASAYMAAEQLAKNPKVQEVKVSQDQLKSLPAGAIVVWDRGNGHQHGHISIATGDGKEASDLMRNQITNYGTSFRVFMPK